MNSNKPTSIDGEWHRISPIAVVFFLAKTLKQLGGQFIYLIPMFLILGNSIKQNPGVTIPAIIIAIALLIGFAVLSFLVYRYRLTNDTIEIRSGILNKKPTFPSIAFRTFASSSPFTIDLPTTVACNLTRQARRKMKQS